MISGSAFEIKETTHFYHYFIKPLIAILIVFL